MSLFNDLLAKLIKQSNPTTTTPPYLQVLEERVLYSAAPIPTDLLETLDVDSSEIPQADPELFDSIDGQLDQLSTVLDQLYELDRVEAPPSYELVVIDRAVQDYQVFVDDLMASSDSQRQFELVFIESDRDGVQQLSEIIAARKNIDAIHLVSHGSDGQLQLGNSNLSSQTLDQYRSEISQWKYSLDHDADILVYGCDVAASQTGESFVHELALLTETDIAASRDVTGHTSLGGDWDFELQVGALETEIAFSMDIRAAWESTLFQFETDSESGSARSMAIDDSGNQYVVVTANHSGTDGDDIILAAADSGGSQIIAPVFVNSTTTGDQKWASVAVSSNANRIVVVWTDDDNSGNLGVFAKIYNTSGTVITSDFQVDTPGSDGNDASVSMADDGTFIVAWEGSGPEDSEGIYARRYNLNGVAIDATPFSVNDGVGTSGPQNSPDVAMNDSHEFVIAWDDFTDTDTDNRVYYRWYNSSGVAQFDGDTGLSTDVITWDASVDIASNGNFVVAQTEDTSDSGKAGGGLGALYTSWGTGVDAKSYNSSGTHLETYAINDTQVGPQQNITALIFDDGSVAFSWEGEGADGEGIYTRTYDSGGTATTGEVYQSTSLIYSAGTDTPSPEHGAAIVDPDDGSYVVWNELSHGIIAKTGASTFAVGQTGAGYVGGQLVEGFHASAFSVGNTAPSMDDSPVAVDVNEFSPNGTEVYDVEATDNEGTTLVYAIDSGDPDGIFAIDSDGVITVADFTKLDYDSSTQHRLVVTVTDQNGAGLTVTKIVTVNVEELVSSDTVANINEDTIYVFDNTHFQDNDSDTVTRIQIETLPSNGTLLLAGEAVSAGDEITLSQINQSSLVYLPNANYAGSDTITFRLGDVGGFSTDVGTVTVNMTAVADFNFHALGSELISQNGATLVNDSKAGDQTDAQVAALADGGYVVVWRSTDDFADREVFLQRFDSSGASIGTETLVDDDLTGDQTTPSVAGLKDGGFVIVWERDMGSHTDIYAQRYNAAGAEVDIDGVTTAANSQFVVHQNSVGNQFGAAVAALSDGGFVITWSTNDPVIDGDTGIAARIVTANGQLTDEFVVNDVTSGVQRDVAITALENNQFAIGWVDQSVNSFDVKAKIFDAGDISSGTEFTLNDVTTNRQNNLSLTALANGHFVAAWEANAGQDGAGKGLFAKVVDASGTTVISEFQLNETSAGNQENAEIVALADGGFLAMYESPRDGDGVAVVARRFPPTVVGAGSEFVVNTHQYGDQTQPNATMLTNGQIVATWTSADGDNDGANFGTGVFHDRFEFGVTGDEDTTIALDLDVLLADNDASESIQSITISGVPTNAVLSDGSGNASTGPGAIDVTSWDLSALTITPESDSHEDLELTIQTVTLEASNSDTETTTQKLVVVVNPAVDSPSRTDWNTTTSEDNVLDITSSQLTSGYTTPDDTTLTYSPGSSFDQSTFPPTNSGPNLVWENAIAADDITFDAGITYTSDTGSAFPGMKGAMVFDGSGGGEIPDSALDGPIHDEGTIEFWIKPDSLAGQHILFEWGDANEGISIFQDGSKVLLKVHSPVTVEGYDTEPYIMVADGLTATDFNQITVVFSADDTTILGDTGRRPDFQLYLNGELHDQIVDAPGYDQKIHFHSINDAAGLGKRIGAVAGDDVAFTNFEGQIARFEVYASPSAGEETQARYENESSIPAPATIDGNAFTPGSTITLGSGALVVINQDGSITYDPNEAFETLNSGDSAQDTFDYTIQTASGGSDTVTVTIDITGEDAVNPTDLTTGIEINEEGNDAYFLADDGSIMNGLDELTVEIMFASDSTSDAALLSYQTTDQPNGPTYFDDLLIQYRNGGTLDIYLPGNGGTATLSGLSGIDYSTIMDGELHGFAFRWDATNGDWAVLVDGVVTDEGTGAATGQSLANGGELVLGQNQDSPNGDFDSSDAFQGTFYDVRIWDHQRTTIEVADDYSNKFHASGLPTGLLANWQFDQLSGGGSDTVTNAVSGGNDLTLQAASGVGYTTGSSTDELQVAENTASGTHVGFAVPTDIDGSSRHTFTLLNDAGGRFAIDTNTGEITVALTNSLDFEDSTSHVIRVQVTDGDGGTYHEDISISVLDANDPVAIATNTGTTVSVGSSGNIITNSVLNEGDEDATDHGANITYTVDATPSRGTLRLSGVALGIGDTFTQADIDSLSVTYDHTAGDDTNDSFDFTIRDGMEDGTSSTSATFNITVNSVNSPPNSASNTITINEDNDYTVQEADFSYSDSDGDGLDEVQIVTAPLAGSLFNDGVLLEDGDTISIADIQANRIVFSPAENENGNAYATVEFRVRADNGVYQAGTSVLTFNVTPINDDPEVHDLVYGLETGSGETFTGDRSVLYSASDADGDSLTATVNTGPSNGTLSLNPDGTFTYTHDGSATTFDTFTYTVSDSNGGLTTANVRIHIDSQGLSESNEFVVNQDTVDHPHSNGQTTEQSGRLSSSSIAIAENGDYVVVWSSQGSDGEFDLMMRRYDFSGTAISDQTIISQNGGEQDFGGTIAMAPDGSFVVVWSTKHSSNEIDVFARRFDANGEALGNEFLVSDDFSNTMPDDFNFGNQTNPSIAMNSSGDFVVVWDGGRQDADTTIHTDDIYLRRFAADGTAGDVIVVNDADGGSESRAAVSLDDSGDAFVIWDDGTSIHGRQVFSNNTLGAEFAMPAFDSVLEVKIGSLDSNNSSRIAFSYQARVSDGMGGSHWETHLQVIDPTNPVIVANPHGNQFQSDDQISADVSFHDDGTLLMTWHGQSTTDGSDAEDVFGRRFRVDTNTEGDPIARAVGDDFLIAQTTTGNQRGASVAGLDSENFVVVWVGEDEPGSTGIFARQYGNQTTYDASGSVLEDVNGDAQLGDAVAVSGATVKLYRDDGDGVVSADDQIFREVVTDGSGNYTLTGLQRTTQYWIVVDSKTVTSAATINSGFTNQDTWAEQTYGDGGAKFGGETGGVSDDASQLSTSQHRSLVTMAAADTSGVDFGFSFNVVTHSDGGDSQDDDAAANDRSVQGSLRQFITNANALDGSNHMHFVPVTTADRTPLGAQIWEIQVSAALPEITDEGTVIDGRAYENDGITRRNSNSNTLGYTGNVGVGADGVADTGDEYTFSGLDAPELEISDLADVSDGLVVLASNTEISHISIHGFGAAIDGTANIRVSGDSITGVQIHDNIIGARADQFVAPNTAPQQTHNILIDGADNGRIEDNLIGFAGSSGVLITGESDFSTGANNWVIEHNDIRSNGRINHTRDGIDFQYDSQNNTVHQNHIAENYGYGLDSFRAMGSLTITDNTFDGNGVGGLETGGVRLMGTDSTVQFNVLVDNSGAGVHVVGRNTSVTPTIDAATENLISQNAFSGNSSIGIDQSQDTNRTVVLNQGDGQSVNGVAPDTNAGNLGLDYPMLTEASFSGGSLQLALEINGAFDEIEIYAADMSSLTFANGIQFGQGAIYLGTLTAADLTYNSGSGLHFGTLTTPANGWPTTVTTGGKITTLAFRNNNTSEFGNALDVALGGAEPTAVDSSVTATEDTQYTFQRSDFSFTDLTNSQYYSVRIDAMPSGGTLLLNGVAVNLGDSILGSDIDDGDLVYVPDADQNGVAYDTFHFSVNDGAYHSAASATMTVDVTPVNDAPEFTAPYNMNLDENQSSVGTVAVTDADGDSLYYVIVGGDDASHFTINSTTGHLTFNSAPDFESPSDNNLDNTYEIVVRVNDGQTGITDQAIEITVDPVNDNAPDLVNLNLTVTEGTTIVPVGVYDADLPGDTVTVTITGGADGSRFSYDAINNRLVFDQVPDYEVPHDADLDNQYEVELTLNDNAGSIQTRTVTITVDNTSDGPVAHGDSFTLNEGDDYSGTVIANDSYSGPVTVSLVSGPNYGQLNLNSDGTFTYNHGGAEVHDSQFVYQISDAHGQTDTGQVRLNITPVDDAPVAQDDKVVAVGNAEIDITKSVLVNDFDVDSRISDIQIITQPDNGKVTIDSNGNLIFTPDANFDGQTSFQYSVEADGQVSAAAIVVVDVVAAPSSRNNDAEPDVEPDQEEPTETNDDPIVEDDLVGGEGSNPQDNSGSSNSTGNDGNLDRSNLGDSLADTNNAESRTSENTEINLYSDEYASFTTYVYSSDVELISSESAARQQIQNSRAVSQFNHELLAAEFLQELDAAKDQFYTKFDITMPSLAMAGTSFLTVGYLAWMVRGGVLLTTFMSSIPAWRMLDPLAVLESASADDAQDDQSISQIVDH